MAFPIVSLSAEPPPAGVEATASLRSRFLLEIEPEVILEKDPVK